MSRPLNRREFNALVPAAPPADRAMDRPNVLWLIAEDMCPDLGCYGQALNHTPHLDRLAAQGIRFTRAYSAAPVCSTSSLQTGMYQTTIGVHHHRSHRGDRYRLPEGVRLFSEMSREQGVLHVQRDLQRPRPVPSRQDGLQISIATSPSTGSSGANGRRASRSSLRSTSTRPTAARRGTTCARGNRSQRGALTKSGRPPSCSSSSLVIVIVLVIRHRHRHRHWYPLQKLLDTGVLHGFSPRRGLTSSRK